MNYFIYTHPLGTESKKKQKKTTKKNKKHMLHGKAFPPAQCQMPWPYELPFPHQLIFSLGFHI